MSGVFVVGALHLDVVVTASHLPALDETVVGSSVAYQFGGKGGNQAVAAARHGVQVAMAGRVGDDDFGARLLAELVAAGVDCAQVARGVDASGMSVAIVEETGEYGAVIVSAANRGIDPAELAVPENSAILLLQNEIPDPVNLAAARCAKAAGAEVWLNAAPARPIGEPLMELVDVLVVNRTEAAGYAEFRVDSPEEGVSAARALCGEGRAVIVTLGESGLVHMTKGGRVASHAAFPVDILSSHGAGDAFMGALAARRANGESWDEALHYAQAAAALHVSAKPSDRALIGPVQVETFLRTATRKAPD